MACLLYSPYSLTARGIGSILPSSRFFTYKIPSLFHVGRARLDFTAHIERPQLHREGSASKKGTWPLPLHPSEAARCASTEDHQAPSPPLLREQGTCMGVIPPLHRARIVSKKDGLAAPLPSLKPAVRPLKLADLIHLHNKWVGFVYEEPARHCHSSNSFSHLLRV
jgi:hypothetical protein